MSYLYLYIPLLTTDPGFDCIFLLIHYLSIYLFYNRLSNCPLNYSFQQGLTKKPQLERPTKWCLDNSNSMVNFHDKLQFLVGL